MLPCGPGSHRPCSSNGSKEYSMQQPAIAGCSMPCRTYGTPIALHQSDRYRAAISASSTPKLSNSCQWLAVASCSAQPISQATTLRTASPQYAISRTSSTRRDVIISYSPGSNGSSVVADVSTVTATEVTPGQQDLQQQQQQQQHGWQQHYQQLPRPTLQAPPPRQQQQQLLWPTQQQRPSQWFQQRASQLQQQWLPPQQHQQQEQQSASWPGQSRALLAQSHSQQQQQQQQSEAVQGSFSGRSQSSRLLQQRKAVLARQQRQREQEQLRFRQITDDSADEIADPLLGVPRQQFKLKSSGTSQRAWYRVPKFSDPKALHTEILARSGQGKCETIALLQLLRMASCSRDAQLALSAVSAVRAVAVSQGRMAPWPDKFTKAFILMTTSCEAHEVLLSALQRPNELGFVFKFKSLYLALKHWGATLAVDKLERIMFVMRDAGLQPDNRMAYSVVRACVNAGEWERVDRILVWFRDQGVTRFKPAMESLLQQRPSQ